MGGAATGDFASGTLQSSGKVAWHLLRPVQLRVDGALCSPVAQQVEQAGVNRWVAGSSPARGANFPRKFSFFSLTSNQTGVHQGCTVKGLASVNALASRQRGLCVCGSRIDREDDQKRVPRLAVMFGSGSAASR